jgi:hypothetical protein
MTKTARKINNFFMMGLASFGNALYPTRVHSVERVSVGKPGDKS